MNLHANVIEIVKNLTIEGGHVNLLKFGLLIRSELFKKAINKQISEKRA